MVSAKVSLAKYHSNFAGLEVSFFLQKAISESQIVKTKEIGEKASRAHKNIIIIIIKFLKTHHTCTLSRCF